MEQMDSDNRARRLAREICSMRVYLSCATTLYVAVKTEHVFRSATTCTSQHFAVGIRIPQRRVVLGVGFFHDRVARPEL